MSNQKSVNAENKKASSQKSTKVKNINTENLIKKIKTPSNNFDSKMKEIDELISNLDPKYSKIIKSKVKEIIEKYDKLAIELISTYEENESINENLPLNEGSKEKAEKFYSIHKGKPFYKDLIEFMTSGKIVTLALSYNNVYDPTPAFEKYRDLIGDTDPKESKTGTIRNLYGTDIAKNAVHGADSSENAKSEILYFFPEFVNKLI
jgi:nucleoside-diphosphate kinase